MHSALGRSGSSAGFVPAGHTWGIVSEPQQQPLLCPLPRRARTGQKGWFIGKKDGLPERGRSPQRPRSHLCSEEGLIPHAAAVPGSRRSRQPGKSKAHHRHPPRGPVKRYLCAGWEVCTRAAKAATSRRQMLHLPPKHPSRTANKNGGR